MSHRWKDISPNDSLLDDGSLDDVSLNAAPQNDSLLDHMSLHATPQNDSSLDDMSLIIPFRSSRICSYGFARSELREDVAEVVAAGLVR